MENWQKEIIRKKLDEVKKEETRIFSIVLGCLEEKYHGYVIAVAKPIQVWYTNVDEDYLKELKQAGFPVKQWKNKKDGTDSGLRIDQLMPMVGINGCYQMADEDPTIGKYDVLHNFVESAGRVFLVVEIVSEKKGKRFGIVEIEKSTDLEKAASNAVRKALQGFGIGRFPVYKTPYSDHPVVKRFREFMGKETHAAQDKKQPSPSDPADK